MDKWPGKGKQAFPERVSLEVALKYGQMVWCLWACFLPHKRPSALLKETCLWQCWPSWTFFTSKCLFEFALKMTKSFKITEEKLHCAKALVQELEYIIPFIVAQKLKNLRGEIDDVFHCEVSESFNIHFFFKLDYFNIFYKLFFSL
jgi:hypothetical protein